MQTNSLSFPSLINPLLAATTTAAAETFPLIGRADRHAADAAATDAMRWELNDASYRFRVVTGEGERDQAPMLKIGEVLGTGDEEILLAVDPLEGTNLAAFQQPGAITVIAATPSRCGFLLSCPDTYMRKLVIGPRLMGALDISRPVADNIKIISKRLGKPVSDVTIAMLDRDRHRQLIEDVRVAGARVKLVSDGDINLGLLALFERRGVDALMGVGAAPEGVITAAAARCMGGEMQAVFCFRDNADRDRAEKMSGRSDLDRIMRTEDLADGDVMFVATGVTTGEVLKGIRQTEQGLVAHHLVMCSGTGLVLDLDTYHRTSPPTRIQVNDHSSSPELRRMG
jgi:fructose-1,6-bisphosphatase class II